MFSWNAGFLFLAHTLAWFVLGALSAVAHGHPGTMRFKTAIALGVCSFALQMILRHLGYIHF